VAIESGWADRGQGLFFPAQTRSDAEMNRDLENVIRQTLADARAAGHDHVSQTEFTVRAVLKVRPDMTASDALMQVNRMRRS